MPAPKASKKRKKPGEMGCEGAYFLPTATRSLAAGELIKAASVETHISSLRPSGSGLLLVLYIVLTAVF